MKQIDIVAAIKRDYPGYSKAIDSICKRPSHYGVCLIPEAERIRQEISGEPGEKGQTQMVLEYMKKYGSITSLEAARDIGCQRLSARIWDLRRCGIVVISDLEIGKNRHGKKVRYARYRLKEK